MLKRIRHHWLAGEAAQRKKSSSKIQRVALIGAPDDRGVMNSGGRVGASYGPGAARAMLGQFMLGLRGQIGRISLDEGFDISPGESIEAGHAELRQAVSSALRENTIPIVIGGGHDYGYPHIAGSADASNGKVAVVNIDAHMDVRPISPSGITSGSPFFLALEEGVLAPKRFVEFGIQEHCNDESFWNYAQTKGFQVVTLNEARSAKGVLAAFQKLVQKLARQDFKVIVSFDLDAVQAAHAPGVSAPQSDGFTPEEFLGMAEFCGKTSHVLSVGFFELAPPLDEGQRATRLAATAIHRFLSGLSERKA